MFPGKSRKDNVRYRLIVFLLFVLPAAHKRASQDILLNPLPAGQCSPVNALLTAE